MSFDRCFVIGGSLTLYKGDGTGGTGGQAVPQPIAVVVPQQLCLAVHHANGALVTGVCAHTAAIAFPFINLNDSSDHFKILHFLDRYS